MTDNVIILGAGASVDAGIPLLSNFVEKMWEFAVTGTYNGTTLSDEDKRAFEQAIRIRNELDSYHGRASFDDRNIEDILSILSFNLIGGKQADRDKLDWLKKAIARTIELTCTVKHNGNLHHQGRLNEYDSVYNKFWERLFKRFGSSINSFPSIITFNYDLVLERSLFQILTGTQQFDGNPVFPFDGIVLTYHYQLVNNLAYRSVIKNTELSTSGFMGGAASIGTADVALEKCSVNEIKRPLNIEIIKLHGSLNFPVNKPSPVEEYNPMNIIENPYILPPIINKQIGVNEEPMWGSGLNLLREAKNIVIVGYSLPQTDIYMQYFLRAGIGPNVNLNKITVFNPVLFRADTEENTAMRERFGSCFSPQLQKRINFTSAAKYTNNNLLGSFSDFVEHIKSDRNLFFG